ncbi:MAG: transposase [Bacteroidales bacterium]|nr:transposase [Bacteroidales bacterium]
MKEAASMLWNFTYMGAAKKRWQELLGWISRCRLQPMIQVGNTVRNYLWVILNAIRLKVNNNMFEAKNTRIQRIKKIACDFRNRERFNTAILFHLGTLDFSPSPHDSRKRRYFPLKWDRLYHMYSP